MRIAKALGVLGTVFALSLVLGGVALAEPADEAVSGYYGHFYVDLQTGVTTLESGVPLFVGNVYDNSGTSALFAVSSTDLTSIWGDRVTTVGTGVLDQQVFTLFNSGSSGGNLLTATIALAFFDGSTSAPLGGYNTNVNFGAGLPPGFFSLVTVTGISPANINLNTTDVLALQQVTAKTGPSARLGIVSLSAPVIGSSGPDMYINSSTIGPAGFYTFMNGPANPGYRLSTIDAPVPTHATTWGKFKDGYR